MLSKWYGKKDEAVKLRRRGISIVKIGERLEIPKSTLSGWFKDIKLTAAQKQRLLNSREVGLIKAREKASKWHRKQKEIRLAEAVSGANDVLRSLNLKDKNISELAIAMLYMGEGIKGNSETGMGNSDSLVLKSFLHILKNNFNVDIRKIRAELYLRADQSGVLMKKFWSNELKLPMENFKYVHFDRRTAGSKTFESYKGVCMIRCSNVAIQRKLINISREFCKRIIEAPLA